MSASQLPSQPANDPLVFNMNVSGNSPDRRYPFFNGGGRLPVQTINNVVYRSPWCRHGWHAQDRQPFHWKNSSRTIYGCRGYVRDHEQADDWDCGYAEEGIHGVGVPSIQVLNPAWDGRFWPFPSNGEWYKRNGTVLPTTTSSPVKATPPSSPDRSGPSSSPSAGGSASRASRNT
ncbi:unnamed protein product [Peniophora sp. CBMAI 1063]|nr:unnamed protein product [Peniophora sp. CBMAI 1063]